MSNIKEVEGKIFDNETGKSITFMEYMRAKDETEKVLNEIPKAELININMEDTIQPICNPKKIKAVVVNGDIVASVSRHYKLVQHKEAFEPIFKGLNNSGIPYKFALFQTDTKAFLRVFIDEIGDNGSGINIGFESRNSIDGRNAITYLMQSSKVDRKTEIVSRSVKVVDVWGYRQVCSNGMKIRIPLKEHTEIRFEKRKVEEIQRLLTMASRIVHMGEVDSKIKAIKYVVEAMIILKEPIALLIEKAKNKPVGEDLAKKLISKYIGKRLATDIEYQFKEHEEPTLWGLYNAVTYVASHGVKIPTMNGLLDKSANLLHEEILVTK